MYKYALQKKSSGKDIKIMRQKLNMTQKEFAEFVNVSYKTVERWEAGDNDITGPIVTLIGLLGKYPYLEEEWRIPDRIYPLRLWYMEDNRVCTIIDVDERNRRIKIYNYTNDNISRAFGKEEHPTFEDYEEFLESRCFPRTRDKMKLMLRELDLPFYDPFMIIEKTEGRMAEDNYWIKIER